ncbi:MAG: hypothetical protein L6R35_001273 [Caloplaca aegaea]|nr:MAG: hypothetical protein L6R35_001273 [Caloplaca aegaea]
MKEALLDPLTWAFAFYALAADIPNGGIANFFSQLIISFGYTPEESLLYGMPGDSKNKKKAAFRARPDYLKLEWLDLTDNYVQELFVLNDG